MRKGKEPPKPPGRAFLEAVVGQYGHRSLYLTSEAPSKVGNGVGYRLAGDKPWGGGHVDTMFRWEIGEEDLKEMIGQARLAIKFLRKHRGKP